MARSWNDMVSPRVSLGWMSLLLMSFASVPTLLARRFAKRAEQYRTDMAIFHVQMKIEMMRVRLIREAGMPGQVQGQGQQVQGQGQQMQGQAQQGRRKGQ